MDETTELVQQLVAIDSINPDLVPGGAGESAIADFVAGWLAAAGLDVALQEAAPGRANVIGVARGSGGGRSLLLNAHMDTVGVTGMDRPHAPFVQEQRLYGRGAYDMKGGLAACMLAGAAARRRGLRGDVIVAAVVDEEYASIGTSTLLNAWRADAAIVTESTGLQVCVAHKGFVWLEVATQGVAAHGSRPDLGVDAIQKMGQVLAGLNDISQMLRAVPAHPLLDYGSLHASLISGGQELSSYPTHCLLSVERRTLPGETPDQVEGELRSLVERCTANDPAFDASVRTTLVRDPFEVAADASIVQSVLQHAQQVLGQTPELIGHTFWMDAALFAAAGIPTVVFGPSGVGAHAVEEWVDLDSVGRCAEVLLATASDFCA